MITLHEAIRSVQEELIKSQQERIQKGMPELFVTPFTVQEVVVLLKCILYRVVGIQGKEKCQNTARHK
jgi:hypothetical protein